MTLNTHRRCDLRKTRTKRVWLDGVEVTDRCFYADGRRGVVRLYKLSGADSPHRYAIDWAKRSIATEELRGHVRWGVKA